ncbi:MAG: helix-turn-helix transcriptional regulator [bacterium]
MESLSVNSKKSKVFGKTLKRLIDHHSISFNKLGAAIGVTRTHLMGLTTGKYSNPKLNTIDKVSRFFKVSIAQLTGEQEIDFKDRPKDLDFNCEE